MAGVQPLTELEGCVLGLIEQGGPCTPYAIRKEFLASSTPHWSGSAGAIYPLVERLNRRRLLRVVGQTRDGRSGRLYALTASGRRAFLHWLCPPFSALTLGVPPDPIRTRFGFLGLLPPSIRLDLLNEVRDKFRHALAQLKARTTQEPMDPFELLALRGSYLALQARLTWVNEVLATLRRPEYARKDRNGTARAGNSK
jgi:DNA-binding PadR family transcriptional regulator